MPAAEGSAAAVAIEAGRFRISSTSFGPCVLPCHYHERACLSVVLSGTFNECFASRSIECGRAGVLAKPAGERHHDVMHGSRQVIVEPDLEVASSWPIVSKAFDGISYHRSDAASAVAARIAAELMAADSFSGLSVEGLTLELFSAVLRSSPRSGVTGPKPPWLERVRDRLEHDPRVATLAELANIAQVHPAYLARRFRQHFAMSIGHYARRVRLEWAAHQLSTTDEPVSSIALRAGFADQSHFTRAFRAHSGLTPRQYRLATRRSVEPEST